MNLTNNLIIAMPNLTDSIFKKSVNFICQHTPQGAMGLTINHPTNITLLELLTQIDIPLTIDSLASIPIYLGGPMETEHGFILHSNDAKLDLWDQTLKINKYISLSSSKDILLAIANGQGPSQFLITLGYAAWSKGQLEQEMKQNSWLNTTADNESIFNIPTEKRWQHAAMKLGIDINLISSEIGHA
jgi:putative transcriptional regulator